jgi:hypothetical protein
MRRELAALYDMDEREMGAFVDRITLRDALPRLRCPLMVAGGGHDLITPGTEAWRIFEGAVSERELIYYPRGAHDCFNVLSDLRPRVVGWLAHRLEMHRAGRVATSEDGAARDGEWMAAEAVDPEFADALRGDSRRLVWNRVANETGDRVLREETDPRRSARWRWPWSGEAFAGPEVVHRLAGPA